MKKAYGAVELQLDTLLEKSLWHLLNSRNGGPHNHSGCFGEDKKICPSKESNYDSSVTQLTA
jgi:hypothetical protein